MHIRLLLFRWWLAKCPDKLASWLADYLPRRLVYWGLIRAGVTCLKHDEIVPEVPYMAVLKRWGQHAGMPGHDD